MLEFPCPKCRKLLRVDEGLAGKQGRCPSCRAAITFPQPSQALKAAPATGPAAEDDRPLPTEVLVSPPMAAITKDQSPATAPAGEKKGAPATGATPGAATPSGGLAKKLLLLAIAIIILVGLAVYFLCFR